MALKIITSLTENNYSDIDDFVNETGHTDWTEDDLETGIAIFDSTNFVDEDMYGVVVKDDEYHQSMSTSINDKIKELLSVSDVTNLFKASLPNLNDSSVLTIAKENLEATERTSKNTFQAAIEISSSVNKFGLLIKKGSKCPVCGKTVPFMPANGYCSLECAGKDLLKKLEASLSGNYETETPEVILQIRNILDYFNLVLNVVNKIPEILASLATFPTEYKNYATAKINLIFIEIKKIINRLLIKKNELIINLLRRIKFGTIDDKLKPVFAVINQIITIVEQAREKLEQGLAVAYKAINSASGMFYIGPQEYGIFVTAKSLQAICTEYKTDALTYPPAQLGRPYWGSGVMTICFNMGKCQPFSTNIGLKSALLNVDMTKINNIIRKAFPPITAPEYLMDPDLFDIRLALSDHNAPTIQKIVRALELLCVIGGDFIPTYENLKLTNIWFVIAILMCWGPTTRSIFGDFIFHGTI